MYEERRKILKRRKCKGTEAGSFTGSRNKGANVAEAKQVTEGIADELKDIAEFQIM
jgi:hypothetical protein